MPISIKDLKRISPIEAPTPPYATYMENHNGILVHRASIKAALNAWSKGHIELTKDCIDTALDCEDDVIVNAVLAVLDVVFDILREEEEGEEDPKGKEYRDCITRIYTNQIIKRL